MWEFNKENLNNRDSLWQENLELEHILKKQPDPIKLLKFYIILCNNNDEQINSFMPSINSKLLHGRFSIVIWVV